MTIAAAHSELVSVIRWIDDRFTAIDIPDAERSRIAAACFDMTLEHQAAIALLIQKGIHGSALALLRVIAEAFIRGIWFARCAADGEIERFKDDKLEKPLRTLVAEVETALGGTTDTLSRMIAKQWSTLCSFTHTGYKQVTRRYSGPMLKPSYSDAEVAQAIRFAASVGLMAAVELAILSSNEHLALDALEQARAFAAT